MLSASHILFAGFVCKCITILRAGCSLPLVNIRPSDRTVRLTDERQQNKDGAKCGCAVLEGRSTLVYLYFA